MQAQYKQRPSQTRINHYHGAKHQVVGQAPIAPAWRPQRGQNASSNSLEQRGSRMFISRLPMDVKEEDIEELFRKTVGPLKESFIVYNSHGKSKGMAVVHFFRPTDAAVAREKYNGKVVDGKRPIKIEIMSDEPPAEQSSIQRQSLFSRIQGAAIPAPATNGTAKATQYGQILPPRQIRQRKGPRRLNKRVISYKKTAAELDKEMDDYRAAIDD